MLPLPVARGQHIAKPAADDTHSQSFFVPPSAFSVPVGTNVRTEFYSQIHSGPLPSEEVIIADDNQDQVLSAVACDNHNICMEVWEERIWTPVQDKNVWGRFVTGYGQLGKKIHLGPSTGWQGNPSVTYNLEQDEFFVVFEHGSGLTAQGVSITGTIVFTKSLTTSGRNPVVTYITSTTTPTQPYLVLYEGNDDIKGLWLTHDGSFDQTFYLANDSSLVERFPHMTTAGDSAFAVWAEAFESDDIPNVYGCRINYPGGCVDSKQSISSSPYANIPDVAYSHLSNRFFVVWQQDGDKIFGRIVPGAGEPVEDMQPFLVSEIASDQSVPDIVFNPYDNVFLSVWDSGDVNHTLVGQYITGDGMLVDGDSQPGVSTFNIATTAGEIEQPGMGFNHAIGHFIVSWTDYGPSSDFDIHAQYVSSVEEHDWPPFAFGENQEQPAIACDDDDERCLVVAADMSEITPTLKAGFINNNDIFTGTQFITLTMTPQVTLTQPALTFVPGSGGRDDYYVLAATTFISGDADIWAWWIDKDGAVVTTTVIISGTMNQTDPAITYNTDSDKIIAVWQHEYNSIPSMIKRRVLSGNGVISGSAEIVSTSFFEPGTNPNIINGDLGGNLVVWEQSIGGLKGIAARQLSATGGVMDSPHLLTSLFSFSDKTQPAAAYSGDTARPYAVVWRQSDGAIDVASVDVHGRRIGDSVPLFENPLGWCKEPTIAYRAADNQFYAAASCLVDSMWSIYTHRLNEQGQPIGSDLVVPLDFARGDQQTPALAHSNETHAIYLWKDARHGSNNTDIYGRFFPLLPNLSDSRIDAAPHVAAPATSVTVTLTLDNLVGLARAGDVWAITSLPTPTTFVSGTVSDGVYLTSTNVISWNVDARDAEEETFQFQVLLDPLISDGTQFTFTTMISAPLVSPFTVTDSIHVFSGPVLEATMLSVDKTTATAGDTLTYTLLVVNEGNIAHNTQVTLLEPPGTDYVLWSASPPPLPDCGGTVGLPIPCDGIIRFNLGDLGAGETVNITYRVSSTVPALADVFTVTNQAVVTTDDLTDPITRTVSTTVTSRVDLSTSWLQPLYTTVEPSGFITYTVTIVNNGTLTATNGTFAGLVPTYTKLISPTDSISYSFGILLVGQSKSFNFVVQVTDVLTNDYPIAFRGVFSASKAPSSYETSALPVMVVSRPQLNLGISGPHQQQACDTVDYYFGYDNIYGNENATGTVLTVTVPTTYAINSASHPYSTTSPGTLVFDLGTLLGGVSDTVRIDVYIPDHVSDDTKLVMHAWLDTDQTSAYSDTFTTTIRSLCINKSDSPDPVDVLADIIYSIIVENRDVDPLTNVVVTDKAPADVEFIDATNGSINRDTLTCTLGTMNPDDVKTCQVTGSVLPSLDTTRHNQARAEAQNAGKVYNEAWTTVLAPDLRLSTMSVSTANGSDKTPIDHNYREYITYTMRVRNDGDLMANVVVPITIPTNTEFVHDSGTPIIKPPKLESGRLVWRGSVPAQSFVDVGFTVEVLTVLVSGTLLTSEAAITTPQIPSPVYVSATAIYQGLPIFEFVKSVTPAGPVDAGTVLLYTITLRNVGDVDATGIGPDGVVVSDDVPDGTDFLNASGSIIPTAGGTLYWYLGDLPAGDFPPQRELTFTVQTSGAWVTNQACVFSKEKGRECSNVVSNAALSIGKTVSPGPVEAGGLLTYVITVTNNGTDTLHSVTINDELPKYTEFLPSLNDCNYDGNTRLVTCDGMTLFADEVISRTIVVQVDSPLPNGTLIHNDSYEVDCAECASPVPGSPVQVMVNSRANLELGADATLGSLPTGDIIRYTFTVTNTGNEDAHDVRITDTLPSGLTVVGSSDNGCIANSSECDWLGLVVLAGESRSVWVDARASLCLDNGHVLENTDYAATCQDGPAPWNVPVARQVIAPVIDLHTSIEPVPVMPGAQVTMTITMTNNGAYTATQWTVTDYFPAQIIDGQGFTWSGATLGPGETQVRSINGTVASPLGDGQILTNKAVFDAANICKPVTATNTTYIYNVPDLGDSTTVLDSQFVDALRNVLIFTYTVTLNNTGSTTATASMGFTEPGGRIQYVVGSVWPKLGIAPHPDGNGFSWSGDIPQGDSHSLQFAVEVELLEHADVTISSQEITVTVQIPITATMEGGTLSFDPLKLIIPLLDTSYRTSYCAPPYENPVIESMDFEWYRQVVQPYQSNTIEGRMYFADVYEGLGRYGICDGMAARSALDYKNVYPYTVCTLGKNNDLNFSAIKHGIQAGIKVMLERAKNYVTAATFYNEFWNHVNKNNGSNWRIESWILGLEFQADSCNRDDVKGHAVFPYRVVRVGQIVYVYIYDPNFGQDPNRRIEIDLDSNTWRYKMWNGDTWYGTHFRYVPITPYTNVPLIPSHRDHETMLVVNGIRSRDPWGIRSRDPWGEGGEIACINGTFTNTIPNALRYHPYDADLGEAATLRNGNYHIDIKNDGPVNNFVIFRPGEVIGFDGNIQSIDADIYQDSQIEFTNDTMLATLSKTGSSQSLYNTSESGNYTVTMASATTDHTGAITYTVAYTLVVESMSPGETVSLETIKAPSLDSSGPPRDRLEFARSAGDQPVQYDLYVTWQQAENPEIWGQFSRKGLEIGPEDRHIVAVNDLDYPLKTTVCTDKGNNGTIDDCLNVDISALLPDEGPIYPGETFIYTITATSMSSTTQENVIVETVIPPELQYNNAWSSSPYADIYEVEPSRWRMELDYLPIHPASVTLTISTTVGSNPPDSVTLTATTWSTAGIVYTAYPQTYWIEGTRAELEAYPTDVFTIGTDVYYTIRITNEMLETTENGRQENCRITMDIPDHLTLVGVPTVSHGTVIVNGGQIIANGFDLASKEDVTISLIFRVNADACQADACQDIEAIAFYESDQQIEISTDMVSRPLEGLATTKKVLSPVDGKVNVGDTLTYEIKVLNVGHETRSNVELQDCLPQGLVLISGTIWWKNGVTATVDAPNDGCLLISLGELDGGDEAIVELRTRVQPNASGAILNHVQVTGSDLPQVTTGPVTVTVEGLSIDLECGDGSGALDAVSVGDTLHCTAVITNGGLVTQSAVFSDTISEHMDYISATVVPIGYADTPQLTDNILKTDINLPPSQNLQIDFSVAVTDSGRGQVIANQAALIVNAGTIDEFTIKSLPVEFLVKGLEIVKTVSVDNGLRPPAILYTITVANTELDDYAHHNVVISDTAPITLQWDTSSLSLAYDASVTVISQTLTPDQLYVQIEQLDPGKSVTIKFRALPNGYSSEWVENTAYTGSADQKLNSQAKVSIDTTDLIQPRVIIATDYATGIVEPDAVVTYTYTLTNASIAADVFTITYHSSQSWDVACYTPALGKTSFPTLALDAGSATTLIVRLSVPPDAVRGTTDTTGITVTSQTAPMMYATATMTTTVGWFLYLPVVLRSIDA